MPEPYPDREFLRSVENIGQAVPRQDGTLKVTGNATFAADNHCEGMLHAVLAVASIARGRVLFLDVAAARSHPRVVDVMTPANRPPLAEDPDVRSGPFVFRLDLLQNSRVRYAGQPIAVVIAETPEAATEGAFLLAPRFEIQPARVGLDGDDSFLPTVVGIADRGEARIGDAKAAFSQAAHRIEATFETPAQYHNAMEPHAIVAAWEGDRLVIDTPSQGLARAQARIAGLFGIPPGNIEIRSPFLGGGFGGKAFISGPQILCILAARLVARPVKLVAARREMYGPFGHRSASRQTLRLGMDDDGKLTSLAHHARIATSTFDDFFEPAANACHGLYASSSIATSHEAVRIDTGTPILMRGPGEATGSLALECAIDEAAAVCGMDPLDFRIRNYAEVEPITGKPFSSKALRECYAAGAQRFGWSARVRQPRRMRDDDGFLMGWGVGTSIYPAKMFRAGARAVLRADGSALMESGAHEMGQGARTALHQIAADALGLGLDQVEFRTGSSDLPDAGVAGGSGHTATVGTAIHNAGKAMIAKLASLAERPRHSSISRLPDTIVRRDRPLGSHGELARSQAHAEILTRAGLSEIETHGIGVADPAVQAAYALYAHGAVFAEVRVDPELGQIRVTRMVGAFAAGRIVNPRLARSQLLGGMVWGISFALHEKAVVDRRSGRVMNADLAEYRIPVSADIPDLEALLVEEHDPHVNELGIKGVGEIGITGSAGAIANAVWHATGVRLRNFPIRIEDLMTPVPG